MAALFLLRTDFRTDALASSCTGGRTATSAMADLLLLRADLRTEALPSESSVVYPPSGLRRLERRRGEVGGDFVDGGATSFFCLLELSSGCASRLFVGVATMRFFLGVLSLELFLEERGKILLSADFSSELVFFGLTMETASLGMPSSASSFLVFFFEVIFVFEVVFFGLTAELAGGCSDISWPTTDNPAPAGAVSSSLLKSTMTCLSSTVLVPTASSSIMSNISALLFSLPASGMSTIFSPFFFFGAFFFFGKLFFALTVGACEGRLMTKAAEGCPGIS